VALLWGGVVIATCTTNEGPYPSCFTRPRRHSGSGFFL
jgi:hypothetical protein